MRGYYLIVVVIGFLVNLLLLLAANRVCGSGVVMVRYLGAALLGGIYGICCILPELVFLGSLFWRMVFLGLIGCAAFGYNVNGLRKTAIFALLSMALGGIVDGMGEGKIASLCLGLSVLLGLYIFCFRGQLPDQKFVEVELYAHGKREKLLALRDTGNGLRDPVTGQNVLVADAKSAQTLLGLNRQQLSCPVDTVAAGIVPGLRLIPYRTVGQSAGMLVAIRLEHVRIGSWQGSTVVAFAPEGLGENNTFRALTGGMV